MFVVMHGKWLVSSYLRLLPMFSDYFYRLLLWGPKCIGSARKLQLLLLLVSCFFNRGEKRDSRGKIGRNISHAMALFLLSCLSSSCFLPSVVYGYKPLGYLHVVAIWMGPIVKKWLEASKNGLLFFMKIYENIYGQLILILQLFCKWAYVALILISFAF